MAEIPYRTVIEMQLYLMVSSLPDTAYAVCTCARFMDCPGNLILEKDVVTTATEYVCYNFENIRQFF